MVNTYEEDFDKKVSVLAENLRVTYHLNTYEATKIARMVIMREKGYKETQDSPQSLSDMVDESRVKVAKKSKVQPNRVKFMRYKTIVSFDSNNYTKYSTQDEGPMQGVILGFVVKPSSSLVYGNGQLQLSSSGNKDTTFAVIGCDDGKIEERTLSSIEYVRD